MKNPRKTKQIKFPTAVLAKGAVEGTPVEKIAEIAATLRKVPGVENSAEAIRQACELLEMASFAKAYSTPISQSPGAIGFEGNYEEGILEYQRLRNAAPLNGGIPEPDQCDLTMGYDERGVFWMVDDSAHMPFTVAVNDLVPGSADQRDQLRRIKAWCSVHIYKGDTARGEGLVESWKEKRHFPVDAYRTMKHVLGDWWESRVRETNARNATERSEPVPVPVKPHPVRKKKPQKDRRRGARPSNFERLLKD